MYPQGNRCTARNVVGPTYTRETMRITWNGSLTFGLVSIPVGLAPATKPAARQSDVSFRLLHRECLTPIKQKRWCPKHDREVGPDEIVKGWEVAKGQFVVVEEAELEALERHDDSRRSTSRSSSRSARSIPSGSTERTSSFRALRRRSGGPTGCCSRRCGRPASVRSAASSARAASRSASCAPEVDALVLETLYLAEDVYSQAEIEEAVEETDVKRPSSRSRSRSSTGSRARSSRRR